MHRSNLLRLFQIVAIRLFYFAPKPSLTLVLLPMSYLLLPFLCNMMVLVIAQLKSHGKSQCFRCQKANQVIKLALIQTLHTRNPSRIRVVHKVSESLLKAGSIIESKESRDLIPSKNRTFSNSNVLFLLGTIRLFKKKKPVFGIYLRRNILLFNGCGTLTFWKVRKRLRPLKASLWEA